MPRKREKTNLIFWGSWLDLRPPFQNRFRSRQKRLEGQTVYNHPHLLLWTPHPFWIVPGGPTGVEELLLSSYQPQSPTSALSKAALHPSLFPCKPTPACLCSHPRTTKDKVSMIPTLTSIPPHDFCPAPHHCSSSLPCSSLDWVTATAFWLSSRSRLFPPTCPAIRNLPD